MDDSLSTGARPTTSNDVALCYRVRSMDNHSEMIDTTADALTARLNGSNLRALAADLYDDAGKAGLLSDVRHRRYAHVSHANLHDLRRRLGLPYDVRHTVDVPADHDAQVHVTPHGTGSLHTYTVPDDAEVVIVPAGARIVQSKTTQPRRHRVRLDITGLGLTPTQARRILEMHRNDFLEL